MAGIGEIRVDLVANTVKFRDGIQGSLTLIERFKYKVQDSMSKAGGSIAMFAKRTDAIVGLERSFRGLNTTLTKTSSALLNVKTLFIGVAAAAGTLGAINSLGSASDKVDKLGKAAARLKVSMKDISVLRYAAGQADIDFEQLTALSSKGLKNIAELVGKGKQSIRLGDIKVQLTDTEGRIRSIVQLLPDLARGLSSIKSPGEQLLKSEGIFGRGNGERFLTFINETGPALEGLRQKENEARRLNVIFTDEQVRKLTDMNDAVDRLKNAWLGVRVEIATEIAPIATEFLDGFANRLAKLPEAAKAVSGALRVLAYGGLDDKFKANAQLRELREAAWGVLSTTAVEGGKLFATTFVHSLDVGIRAIGPSIGDVFRDNVGPILNNIPLVNIPLSTRGQLAKLQDDLKFAGTGMPALTDEAKGLRIRLGSPQSYVGSSQESPKSQLARDEDRLKVIESTLRNREASLAKLRADIASQEAAIRVEQNNRTIALATGLKDLFDSVPPAADAAGSKINAAWARLHQAGDGLIETFRGIASEGQASTNVTTFSLDRIAFGFKAMESQASASGRSLVRVYDLVAAGVNKIAVYQQELAARGLEAGGDETGAARMRLQLKFVQEQGRLLQEFKGAPPEVLAAMSGQLRGVQSAELAAFNSKAGDKNVEELRRQLRGYIGKADPKKELMQLRDELISKRLAGEIPSQLNADFELAIQGIDKQMSDLEAKAESLGNKLKETVEGFADDASRAFARALVRGQGSFKELLLSWTETLVAMSIQTVAFKPFFTEIAGGLGDAATRIFGSAASAAGSSSIPYANRGAQGMVNSPTMKFGQGGVALSPTSFPLARGIVAEAGKSEGMFPLSRMRSGNLGVEGVSRPVNVQVIDQRGQGATPEVTRSTGPNGEEILRILVRDEFGRMSKDGSTDRLFGSRYGIRPRPL